MSDRFKRFREDPIFKTKNHKEFKNKPKADSRFDKKK